MSTQERVNRFRALLERLRERAGGAHPVSEASQDPGLGVSSAGDVTGQTVFGDRPPPLLHNLTGEPVEGSLSDAAFQAGAFKIRLARSRTTGEQAGTLVERRYAWRGYQTPGLPADPNLRTFVAYRDGKAVGTVSIRVDSSKGLSADKLYKTELAELRDGGARLCEFTRLAVDDDAVYKN